MFTRGESNWGSTKWVKGVRFLGTKLLVMSILYCILKSKYNVRHMKLVVQWLNRVHLQPHGL